MDNNRIYILIITIIAKKLASVRWGHCKMSKSSHLIMFLFSNMTKLQENKLTPKGKLHIPFFK